MTKIGLPALLVLFFLVAACEPRALPSRGLEVDLLVAQTTVEEVAAITDEFFQANGFSILGKDGFEELSNQRLSVIYSSPEGILGSVGLDSSSIVPVRVNVRADVWSPEANLFFEELALTLESRWPGSVQREPLPAEQ